MDFFFLVMLIAIGANALRLVAQRKRIALLGSYLAQFQIEKNMETLTQGYLRALGEQDLARREQVWQVLETAEAALSDQFSQFAREFSQVPAPLTRVSRLPIGLPLADQWFPKASFDLRKLLVIHAKGIKAALTSAPPSSRKDRAFTMMAELLLMQHSCHWYCKSKAVASTRLLLRHQTAYQQVLASVSAPTRQAYLALLSA